MKLSISAQRRIQKTSILEFKRFPVERETFIKLFKEYNDVFSWIYDDLKTYNTKIIQHIIALEEDVKPFQQKLQKMHPSLEQLLKKELNKLLANKIIFPVQHTTWMENLVLVMKMY